MAITTDVLGFVVTMHPGLCEQNVQSLGLSALGLRLLLSSCLMKIPPSPSHDLGIPKRVHSTSTDDWDFIPHCLFGQTNMKFNIHSPMHNYPVSWINQISNSIAESHEPNVGKYCQLCNLFTYLIEKNAIFAVSMQKWYKSD